jgi:hypothetical protein
MIWTPPEKKILTRSLGRHRTRDSMLLPLMMGSSAGGGPTNVMLLMHFDGADGSTDFIDATGNTVWTVAEGSPVLSTAESIPANYTAIGTTWPTELKMVGNGDDVPLSWTMEFRTTLPAGWSGGEVVFMGGGTFYSGSAFFIVLMYDGHLAVYGGVYGSSGVINQFTDLDEYITPGEPMAIGIMFDHVSGGIYGAINGHKTTQFQNSCPAWYTSCVGKPLWIGDLPPETGQSTGAAPGFAIDELRIVSIAMFLGGDYTVPSSAFTLANAIPYN